MNINIVEMRRNFLNGVRGSGRTRFTLYKAMYMILINKFSKKVTLISKEIYHNKQAIKEVFDAEFSWHDVKLIDFIECLDIYASMDEIAHGKPQEIYVDHYYSEITIKNCEKEISRLKNIINKHQNSLSNFGIYSTENF